MIALLNEFKKIWNVKNILILFIILLAVNTLYYFAAGVSNEKNWRENAKEIRELDEQYIKEFATYEEYTELDYELYQKTVDDITIIDYSLENNIPYGNYSVWNHIINMQNLLMLFVLVITVYGCKVLGSEYDSGTWKNVLMHFSSRNSIIINKIIYVLLQTVSLTAVVFLVNFLFGAVFYGHVSNIAQLSVDNGQIVTMSVLPQIIRTSVIILFQSCFFVLVGYLANLLSGKSKTSLIITFVLLVFSGQIENVLEKTPCYKVLPFYWINQSDASLIMNNEWNLYIIAMLMYLVIISILNIIIFNKKEIS